MKTETLFETEKVFEGNFHTRNDKDIRVKFEIALYPNINQIINIESTHSNRVRKAIGLSLNDVLDLRDFLQTIVDNSPIICKK